MVARKKVFCSVFLLSIFILLMNIKINGRETYLWTHIQNSYQRDVYINSSRMRLYHVDITGRETVRVNVTNDVSGTAIISEVKGTSKITEIIGTSKKNDVKGTSKITKLNKKWLITSANRTTKRISQSGRTTRLPNDSDRISNDNVEPFLYDDVEVYQAAKSIHDASYTKKTGDRCLQRLPQCIIIGSFKAGTKEIIDFMAMHPNIVIKSFPIYELNYFSNDLNFQNKLNINYERLRSRMPCSFSDQITVFKDPGYFANDKVPERLYRYNKSLKMILLVREPVERLISHLTFISNRKHVPHERYLKEFVQDDRIRSTHVMVRQSTYDESWKRYLQYFSANQILILEDKELKYDPANVLKKVESFLGLPNSFSNEDFVYNVKKQFYCVKINGKGYCYGNERGRIQKPQISPQTMNLLTEFYKPHNENFFAMINRTFDW